MMNEAHDSDYEELGQLLAAEGIFRSPANIHGKLCGYLTAGVDLRGEEWLTLLAQDLGIVDGIQGATAELLLRVSELMIGELEMRDFSLRLLLPGDDAPLNERSWELGQWCAGYISSLHAHAEEQIANASDAVAEVLDDLEEISGISDEIEESQDSEIEYMELAEYIRLAVIDLYDEFLADR